MRAVHDDLYGTAYERPVARLAETVRIIKLIVSGEARKAGRFDGEFHHLDFSRLARDTILTPHDREAERLGGAAVGGARLEWARSRAKAWRAVVVLKGATTIVASPSGDAFVHDRAEPALATQVLKIANSALFASQSQCTSVDRAPDFVPECIHSLYVTSHTRTPVANDRIVRIGLVPDNVHGRFIDPPAQPVHDKVALQAIWQVENDFSTIRPQI